ncbi:hypothetical protein BDZ85DRAFT_34512 [Elsinoe ampelina]|uniref:Uncharacterized protein n=1 Tax=Elsinoe ampelina TaxID=302913 RepID=A0A6A6G454_9PEZI|nr:hypothetical protein BDZ85DRAFT_34512 [Elsinoe ampelina]
MVVVTTVCPYLMLATRTALTNQSIWIIPRHRRGACVSLVSQVSPPPPVSANKMSEKKVSATPEAGSSMFPRSASTVEARLHLRTTIDITTFLNDRTLDDS